MDISTSRSLNRYNDRGIDRLRIPENYVIEIIVIIIAIFRSRRIAIAAGHVDCVVHSDVGWPIENGERGAPQRGRIRSFSGSTPLVSVKTRAESLATSAWPCQKSQIRAEFVLSQRSSWECPLFDNKYIDQGDGDAFTSGSCDAFDAPAWFVLW